MIRTSILGTVPVALSVVLVSALPAAEPGRRGIAAWFRGGYGTYDMGRFAPSYYGYNLDDTSAGYYGGGRYREYYNYGRGYGIANYPGPLPGRGLPPDYRGPARDRPMFEAAPVIPEATIVRSAAADLIVEVPADAKIWLEGVPTKQTGATRWFVSPPLENGREYAYEIRAQWPEEGKMREETKHIVVRPGDRLHLRFPAILGEALPEPRRFPLP